jgi:hypothetical protein
MKRTEAAPSREPLVPDTVVAKHIKSSPRFLRDDRAGARLIPFYKLSNKMIRYRLSEVDAALVEKCRRGGDAK